MIREDQAERLLVVLGEIRDAILGLTIVEEALLSEGGCDHPEAQRVDLSTLGDRHHWVCSVCRYDNKGDKTMID